MFARCINIEIKMLLFPRGCFTTFHQDAGRRFLSDLISSFYWAIFYAELSCHKQSCSCSVFSWLDWWCKISVLVTLSLAGKLLWNEFEIWNDLFSFRSLMEYLHDTCFHFRNQKMSFNISLTCVQCLLREFQHWPWSAGIKYSSKCISLSSAL